MPASLSLFLVMITHGFVQWKWWQVIVIVNDGDCFLTGKGSFRNNVIDVVTGFP